MTPVVLGFGLAIGLLIAITKRAQAKDEEAPAAPLPQGTSASTAAAVQKIVDSGDPKKMVAAASVAHQAGDHQLAAGLTKAAQDSAVANATSYPSPWPQVGGQEWTQLVMNLRGKNQRAITPGYTLGLFNFGMRRLVDLGLATNPHKGDYNGKQVWLADWKAPLGPGPDQFLASAQGQYNALVKSMNLYASQIAKDLPTAIGTDIDGTKATLSGLLAVAHRAGFAGLKDWIGSADTRAQHKQVTDLFKKSNGLF